jgi:hypothetical protein
MFGRREKKAVEDFISGVYDRTKVLERNLSHVEDQVYELRKLGELSNARLGEMSADNKALALQLRCMEDYGEHDWVFMGESEPNVRYYYHVPVDPYGAASWLSSKPTYKFGCSRCGHVRSFKWDELTKQDQSALIALGLHKESDDK